MRMFGFDVLDSFLGKKTGRLTTLETQCFLDEFWILPHSEWYDLRLYQVPMFRGFKLSDLTQGEKALLASYVCAGAVGAWTSHIVAHRLLGRDAALANTLGIFEVWTLCAGALGAILAIYLNGRWFGHLGFTGFKFTLVAVLNTTFVATVIGGTLALPIFGTMFGPLAITGTFWSSPPVLYLWLASLLGANYAYGLYRKERASVFLARLSSEEDPISRRL